MTSDTTVSEIIIILCSYSYRMCLGVLLVKTEMFSPTSVFSLFDQTCLLLLASFVPLPVPVSGKTMMSRRTSNLKYTQYQNVPSGPVSLFVLGTMRRMSNSDNNQMLQLHCLFIYKCHFYINMYVIFVYIIK